MELSVYFRTYALYGEFRAITLIGDYLVIGAPNLGESLNKVEVTIHFRNVGPPRKTLETLYERFHGALTKLRKVTFRRTKKKADSQSDNGTLELTLDSLKTRPAHQSVRAGRGRQPEVSVQSETDREPSR